MHLLCPRCRNLLHRHEVSNGYYCDNKHHFDVSPEGYLDLLPGQKKCKTADSRSLMRAKRKFLEEGNQLLLVEKILDMLKPLEVSQLTHLACGEGYYCRMLSSRLPAWKFIGVESAKNALFAAAKAQPEMFFILADTNHAPIKPGSVEFLFVNNTNVKKDKLIDRLAPGGYLLYVDYGPRHQWQLRSYLHPESKEHPLSWPNVASLINLDKQRCHITLPIDQALRQFIVDSSHLSWRATNEQRHEFIYHGPEKIEFDQLVTLWQKPS